MGIPRSLAVPGTTRIPGGRESAAGYTVLSGKPVISDITKENRFAPSEVVLLSQVRHSVNVLIPTGDELYGVLEADRKDDPPFTAEDIDFLQTFASLIGAAVLRQRDAERIASLLREKELLLRELQHRVKNDLQVIVSMVELQQRRAASADTREQLAAVSGRIDSLRLVHDHLYRSQGLERFDLGDYLRTLAIDRFRMHGLDPTGPIELHTDVSLVIVDRDLATPLGLLANEFITNSMKYAFGDGPGIVKLTLARVNEHQARLTLEDNGRGAPAAGAIEKGTGLRLIELLARQIRSQPTWSREGGTRLELVFDVPPPAAPPA
jgi:two-component sensor histidine kinase